MTVRTVVLGALVLLLAGCTSTVVSGVPTAPKHIARVPAVAAFPALPGAGDVEDQDLSAIAEDHGVVVAAGSTHSTGVWRPLVLVSRDDGRSWRQIPLPIGRSDTIDDRITNLTTRRGWFYAFGDASGGAAMWRSRDATTWTRYAVDKAAIGPDDDVTKVVATSTGFVAVGTRSHQGRFETPEAWTSPDAVHWTAHRGARTGLVGSSAGDTWMADLTRGGAGLVAVGGHTFGHDDRTGPQVWTSKDGVRWRPLRLPEDLGGSGTRSWFDSVWWSGTEYVAVGAGGSGAHQRYAGLFATSTDGATWSGDSSGRGLVTGRDVTLVSGTTWHGHSIALGVQCALACSMYGLTDSANGWQPLRMPTGEGDSPGIGATIVTSRGTILAVGGGNPRHDRDARVWRSSDGRSFTRTRLPAGADGQRPVYLSDLAHAAGRFLVVGTSGGLPVVWTSTDGRRFGRPTALSTDRSTSVSVIRHGPAGWLAIGSQTIGDTAQGVVWTSADGTRWRQSRKGAFGRIGGYSYSELAGAVAWHGWVVVGDRADQGSDGQGALVAHSADGRSWTPATNSAHTRRVGNRTVQRYDLQGDRDGTRAMDDVGTLGSGLVAVGWARPSRGADSYQATIWRSPDARIWTIATLPRLGLGDSAADIVVTSGRTVLVYGSSEHEDVTLGVVWASRDGGRTWTTHHLPGDGGDRVEIGTDVLVRTAHGFVAGGRVGPAGTGRAALWASATGASWRRLRLTDRRFDSAGSWGVNAVVADGRRVIGIATRTSPSGSLPIAFSQAVG